MLCWALVFLIVAIVAGALGFGEQEPRAASLFHILFVVFLVFFVIALIMAALWRRGIADLDFLFSASASAGPCHFAGITR